MDELTPNDLNDIDWSGGPSHPKSVAKALQKVPSGAMEYLAVRSPNGKPIAKGGIDYTYKPGTGYMTQLATMEELRGLGIGTHLIRAMEERILQRGLTKASLGVEDDNPDAQRLYERIGYKIVDKLVDSWEEEDEQGNMSTHHATGVIMEKDLVTVTDDPTVSK